MFENSPERNIATTVPTTKKKDKPEAISRIRPLTKETDTIKSILPSIDKQTTKNVSVNGRKCTELSNRKPYLTDE